jgi:hypothetical protein
MNREIGKQMMFKESEGFVAGGEAPAAEGQGPQGASRRSQRAMRTSSGGVHLGVHMISAYTVMALCTLTALRPTGLHEAQQPTLTTARRATVSISVITRQGTAGSGSGFLLNGDGLVATAEHVIHDAASGSVRLTSGDEFAIEGVLVADPITDFAIVRVAGYALPRVLLGNSDRVKIGQRILVIGAPLGLEATVSDGIVSAYRLVGGVHLFQISAPASPGSSGGPVLTESGSVIALVVSGIRGPGAENLNFALPINYLRGQLNLARGRTPTPLGNTYLADAARSQEWFPAESGDDQGGSAPRLTFTTLRRLGSIGYSAAVGGNVIRVRPGPAATSLQLVAGDEIVSIGSVIVQLGEATSWSQVQRALILGDTTGLFARRGGRSLERRFVLVR